MGASLSALLEHSAQDPRSRARLLAVQRKESNAWLTAMPASSLGLRMEDDAVRVRGSWFAAWFINPFVSLIHAPGVVFMWTAQEHTG